MPSSPSTSAAALLPATASVPVQRVFAWYAERLLRKRFAAVRAATGTGEALERFASLDGPGLLLLSHSSWWDPIIGSFLWRRFWPERTCRAPMDRRQLERFRFMRRLGVFGIDPDDATSLEAMVTYLRGESVAHQRLLIAITPQGRFVDSRERMDVRPGAAAIAAKLGLHSALSVAIEYGFWNEQRPEVFLRAERVTVGPDQLSASRLTASWSTASWQRAIAASMEANRTALAQMVIARDPSRFESLLTPRSATHPVYDLWLRLTGRGGGITTEHRHGERAQSQRAEEARA